MSEKRKVTVDGEEFEVEIEFGGDNWEVSIEGKTYTVEVEGVTRKRPRERRTTKRSTSSESGVLSSAIPGKIVSILVSEGEQVESGSVVLVLEAMKMQNEIKATIDGWVKKIMCNPGERIEANVPLMEISKEVKGEK
ncbi:MAG TPA: biotin/lipoyl-containing protein [Candidatus Thalassarchaeaceae archaeon]|nr:biotin/lipoyl-containing protein [Candidatus Thalassarchaeaceae archaeon]